MRPDQHGRWQPITGLSRLKCGPDVMKAVVRRP
jgi:hypothetical protein